MTPTDQFAWRMERNPVLRSTIASVLILDREPDRERVLRTFERATRVVPRLRHTLSATPAGLAPPRWTPAPDFDLSWHVRLLGLPEPADMAAVLEFTRNEVMTAFDPAHPLWSFTVLTGLPDGKAAAVLKIHHSLTDGIGGILIAEQVLDLTREGTSRPQVDEPGLRARGLLTDVVGWNAANGIGLVRDSVLAAGTILFRTVTDPVGLVRGAAELARSLVRFTRPITTTLSPVMTARSTGRRLSVLEVPLDQLLEAAHRADCTMNDAFLAALLLGARDYHRRHGSPVDGLRVTMPISLRDPDDPIGGNHLTLMRFTLPADIDDAGELMRAVHRVADRSRHEPAIAWSGTVASVLNRMPSAAVAGMLEHVDFVASNVPGATVPLFLAGARLDDIYAFAPTLGSAFNVVLMSHCGTCFVGITVDTAAVPDLPVFAEAVALGFSTVLGAAPRGPEVEGQGVSAAQEERS